MTFALLLTLALGACTSADQADTADQGTTTQETTTTTSAPEPATTTTEPATAAEAVASAVDALGEVGTYGFEAKLFVDIRDEPTEVEIEGWVDGSDRELMMRIGRQEVITRVVDGVATVERDGETVEVPLTEAGSAPSLLILKSIQDASFATDTSVTGHLEASDIASADYEVSGSAEVVVTLSADGDLTGYSLRADDDSWSIDVKFEDIGEDPGS